MARLVQAEVLPYQHSASNDDSGHDSLSEGKCVQYFSPCPTPMSLPPAIFSPEELLIHLWFAYLMTFLGLQSAV